MTKPFFSVVIPALNEEKYLPLFLKDLSAQTAQDFEVIVVDGYSEDKTVAKAQQFSSKLNLTIIHANQRNVSHQRNLGGKKAAGDWILFMDADNRVPSFFIDGIRYQLAKHPKTQIFTNWLKVESKDAVDKAIERSLNFAIELFRAIQKPQGFGALIGCHASVLKKVTFDEKQKFLEDGFFLQQAVKKGFYFSVFREPAFTFSLRRFRKEGTLKLIQQAAILQLKFFAGRDFYNETSYPMLGGSYYEDVKHRFNIFGNVHTFIRTASKKQLDQARSLFAQLKDL